MATVVKRTHFDVRAHEHCLLPLFQRSS